MDNKESISYRAILALNRVFECALILLFFLQAAASALYTYFMVSIPLASLCFYLLALEVYNYLVLLTSDPGEMRKYSGMEIQGRCASCNFLRCERTVHCDRCARCFYKHDHHAAWIGRCIAYKNFRNYFFLVGFLSLRASALLFFGSNPYYSSASRLLLPLFAASTAGSAWNLFLLLTDQTTSECTGQAHTKSPSASRKKTPSLKNLCAALFHNKAETLGSRALSVFFPFLTRRPVRTAST